MGKSKTIGNLLKQATSVQLARVRAHLEQESHKWCCGTTWKEYKISERALTSFDDENYSDEAIARYLDPEIIEKIFG